MKQAEGKAENRNSVRITTRILFGHKKITPGDFARITTDCDNGISLYNRQELADMHVYRSAQNALSRIKERDKDLAVFLQHLDSKMNLLLKKLDTTPTIYDSLTLQKVNLGGNGVAFWSSTPYESDELVEMHMILPPDNYYVNCFGSVVKCIEDSESGGEGTLYRVALKFALVLESDRESLVQFNFKQQSLALQRRRISNQK